MILLVDDDHAITQILKQVLTEAGYSVAIADNGEDAFVLLKKQPVDAMLLDLMMPGINGAALLMLLAAEGIKLPVIMMAGAPDMTGEELSELPGVVDVLKKPFYPEEALDRIRKRVPQPV
jgi:DNA-binding response OmpR family regulator